MSLFEKLRIVTLGNLHDLLDKTIDLNSPSALRQYVRDLEEATNKLNTEAAVQTGQLRTMTREHDDLVSKIEQQKAVVAQLLKSTEPNAAELARGKAQLILTEQKQVDSLSQNLVTQKKTADDLAGAVIRLQNKHNEMVARVRELERIDRDSKAKEQAAHAIQNAGSILGTADTNSVDDLQERMLRRNDVANASFDQAMSSVQAEPETNSGDVDALLASLKS